MDESGFTAIIRDETNRALWEVENVICCIPDALWDKCYCDMPLWKHVYHMLHSLDRWYMNPRVYAEPAFHREGLDSLDVRSGIRLGREEIGHYFDSVRRKILAYDSALTDDILLQKPENCEWTRFTLILAQHRHLHSHMGMLMGFVIEDTGLWPRTLGLEHEIPDGGFGSYV